MDLSITHLFRTDDPNVVIEVTLYAREVQLNQVEREIKSLESVPELEVLVPPPEIEPKIVEAVDVYNLVNEPLRHQVKCNRRRANELRAFLDQVKKKGVIHGR